MAHDRRESIEEVKAEAERLTKKRIQEYEEEQKRQQAADTSEQNKAKK